MPPRKNQKSEPALSSANALARRELADKLAKNSPRKLSNKRDVRRALMQMLSQGTIENSKVTYFELLIRKILESENLISKLMDKLWYDSRDPQGANPGQLGFDEVIQQLRIQRRSSGPLGADPGEEPIDVAQFDVRGPAAKPGTNGNGEKHA